MIGSGHVSEFLAYYRYLYVHFQQGWAHYNSFLKVYFFCHTMRGGGSNKSKIQPLATWLACRMLWMSGVKYSDMLNEVKGTTTGNEEAMETTITGSSELNESNNGVVVEDILSSTEMESSDIHNHASFDVNYVNGLMDDDNTGFEATKVDRLLYVVTTLKSQYNYDVQLNP
jgi:hypothetical protein